MQGSRATHSRNLNPHNSWRTRTIDDADAEKARPESATAPRAHSLWIGVGPAGLLSVAAFATAAKSASCPSAAAIVTAACRGCKCCEEEEEARPVRHGCQRPAARRCTCEVFFQACCRQRFGSSAFASNASAQQGRQFHQQQKQICEYGSRGRRPDRLAVR